MILPIWIAVASVLYSAGLTGVEEPRAPVIVAGWSTSGPLDGPVEALAVDPRQSGVVYAGTFGSPFEPPGGSLWRSADYGVSWTKLGSASNHVVAVGVSPLVPGLLFVAGGYDSFIIHSSWAYRSSDGGATWSGLGAGAAGSLSAFAFDTASPGRAYTAGSWGVARTIHGGVGWTLVLESNAGTSVVAASPSKSLTVYAGGRGVVRSVNGGDTWQSLPTGEVSVRSLAIPPSEPSIVYAGTEEGLLRSLDGGDSWWPAEPGPPAGPVFSIAVDPVSAETLYAITREGVSVSRDGGQNWAAVNRGLPFNPEFPFDSLRALAIDRSGRLYAGTPQGVFVLDLLAIREPLVVPFR